MSRNSTGVIVTSMSCSGTCLIFSMPRQPKVLAADSALGRGGRALEDSAACRVSSAAGPRPGLLRCRAHAATSSVSSSSARWPVSARKTSSRLGWASEKPGKPEPGARQLGDRLGGALGVVDAHRAARRVGLEVRLGVERAAQQPRRLVALRGIEQPDVQRAAADGCLEARRRSLGDDLAAVDDGDAIGELVGLVEVLRAQQHRRAQAGQRADDVPHLVARARVQAGRRLVEEHELRASRRCSPR